jgi:hypothetical protein
MLAGVGAGVFADIDQAAQACVTVVRTQHPRPERKPLLDSRYRIWSATVAALQSVEAR